MRFSLTSWLNRPRAPTARIVQLVVAHKMALLLFAMLIPLLFPTLFSNRIEPKTRFVTWDTEHYLTIAEQGYEGGAARCAFYPLWPALIRVSAWLLGGNTVLAAYLLANFLSVGGIMLFHRFVEHKHGTLVAHRASLLLLLFPGSLFFFFPYSESLFLFLLMLLLTSLNTQRTWAVALAAFLLPMTRAIGIFIIPYLIWENYRKRLPIKTYSICLVPLLGYAAYFGIMYWQTGNALEGFDAQAQFPAQPSISRLLHPLGFLNDLSRVEMRHDVTHSFIDRTIFFAFWLTVFFLFRLDSCYVVFALFSGLVPAITNSLMSFTRYASLVFPLYIAWAIVLRRSTYYPFVLMLFFGLQILMFLLHISGNWAG